eukprot:Skav214716  [mRNA]  locus=scaffold2250:198608:199907:+ [translate_table: standard]
MLPPDPGPDQPSFGAEEMEYVCQCLRANTQVTQLNVSMNPIGDEGARHVAAMLAEGRPPLARCLEGHRTGCLSLNGCSIGAAGGQALAEAVAAAPELMIVELMNNHMGEAQCRRQEGGKALLESLRKNERLKEAWQFLKTLR